MPLFVCGSTAHIDASDNRCRYSRRHSIYIRVSAPHLVSFSLQSRFVRVSVTQMPQISHKWRKYAWQNNTRTNIVAIAAPMLPRQCCHSRCQHECEYESNGPRSRRAFEVLICQANGPNVVNVRAKIKRPSKAIGSKIVTGTSSPSAAERGREGGRLIAVFALVD